MTRLVPFNEHDIDQFKEIAEYLRNQGAQRAAGVVSSLILAWQLSEESEPRFECHIDESAGMAEVYNLDPHSRKVSS